MRISEETVDQSIDDVIGRRGRVDGLGQSVEEQAVERIVEESDLVASAGKSCVGVECHICGKAGALPCSHEVGNVRVAACFEAQFEQSERDVALACQPRHDVAHVVAEQLHRRLTSAEPSENLGVRGETVEPINRVKWAGPSTSWPRIQSRLSVD